MRDREVTATAVLVTRRGEAADLIIRPKVYEARKRPVTEDSMKRMITVALVAAALAAPASASAHNGSTWKWTADLAERKLERMYPQDGQVACYPTRSRAQFNRHFGCADESGYAYVLHVLGKQRFTITNVERYR